MGEKEKGVSTKKELGEKFFIGFLLVFSFTAFLVGGILLYTKKAELLDVFTLWTLSVTTITAFYLSRELQLSIKGSRSAIYQKRVETAQNFLLHFLGHDFQRSIRETRDILEKATSLSKKERDELLNDPVKRTTIIMVLNFFEILGVFYNEAHIDRKLVQESITSMSLDIYKKAYSFFIEEEQRQTKSVYCNWYNMNLDLEKNREKIRCKVEEINDGKIK